MRRIRRVSRLRNCGVFRDFFWPRDLTEFGRYNLIYGWNGSGKTTLSRIFRDLGSRRIPGLGESVLQVDGEVVQNEDFSQSQVQVRVFNRDFIEESVFRVDGKDIPPVFVLGAKNVEKQKDIELLGKQRDASQSNLDAARLAKESAEREYDQYCRARLLIDDFVDCLRCCSRNATFWG